MHVGGNNIYMSLLKNIVWSPEKYADAAVVAREAGTEMLSRLDLMTIKPKVVVDVGCGTGELTALLQKRYPEAMVIGLDLQLEMLGDSGKSVADAACLPLRNQSVDILFANFLLPWHADMLVLLREWKRVLRPDGVLMFSAFGPDTLKEWRGDLQSEHIPEFIDMHDIGDVLLHEGFADPVLDVNYYTTSYREKSRFIHELCASGMWFPGDAIHENFAALENNTWDATYEVVFAHAFAAPERQEHSASSDGVVRVPISALKKQLGLK